MKKWIFIILAIAVAIFATVTTSATNVTRDRDGPVLSAAHPCEVIENPVSIIAKEVRPEAIARSSERQGQSFSDSTVTSIANDTMYIQARPLKLPLVQSGRKSSHLTIADHGRISYHHRA